MTLRRASSSRRYLSRSSSVRKLRIVQRSGGFLAVARDERDGGSAVEQIDRGLDLLFLDPEFFGNTRLDGNHQETPPRSDGRETVATSGRGYGRRACGSSSCLLAFHRCLTMFIWTAVGLVVLAAAVPATAQAAWPNQREGDFVLKDFAFESGETLGELKQHYTVLGTPHRNAAGEIDNAVLLLHGTSGTGKNWLMPSLADELFAAGQPLDASKTFIVMPDGIGRGGSSKPSDGLRAKFPHYRYADIINAQHRLLTEHLGIKHLRLVLGSSMGGMHCWMWGGMYPGFMDALVPIASQPIAISGRNWLSRRIAIEAIRNDPGLQRRQLHDQADALHPHRAVRVADDRNLRCACRRWRRRARPPRRSTQELDGQRRQGRRQRPALRHRGGDRLRPGAASPEDHRPAARHQFRRRRGQSAGVGRGRAGDRARSGARSSSWCRPGPRRTAISPTCAPRSGSPTSQSSCDPEHASRESARGYARLLIDNAGA